MPFQAFGEKNTCIPFLEGAKAKGAAWKTAVRGKGRRPRARDLEKYVEGQLVQQHQAA